MLPVIIVGAIIVIGAAVLVIIGLRNPTSSDEMALQARLEEFSQRGETVDLEKIELSQPFTERVIYPIARKLGEIAIRFTPQNALQDISKKLELAGSPARLDPTIFLASQFIVMIFFAGVIALVFTIGQTRWPTGRIVLAALGFGILGFFFPQLWLSSKITRRQKDIRRAMPDALDLLTICVEAGLGFDAAMAKVSEKWQTELSLAFARVIQEIQLGKLRREALRDMAERVGISEMSSFVAAVIQSESLGVSLAKVLRIQSDQMRTRRRQLAEEEAHKAPIKMLIPMGLLIFPSLMIILLTPAGIRILNSALGGMFR
ncbi:MAG: type II secretion system F family protein [Anaerolineae bacterium]|nr:type II secretion system F family protein [Anaerolineae bacterium]